jgi:DNA-binding CsgD family transcriptional regulator
MSSVREEFKNKVSTGEMEGWEALAIAVFARSSEDPVSAKRAQDIAQPSWMQHHSLHLMGHPIINSLAIVTGLCRDTEMATSLLAELLEMEDTETGMLQHYPMGYVAYDHMKAILAHTIGETDRALDYMRGALAFCQSTVFRPALAWAWCDYAEILWRRNLRGNQGEAARCLDESQSIANELGMRSLLDKVSKMKVSIGSTRGPHIHPKGLTVREMEILGLIGSGKSNREISDELILSIRTVERHLSNIYRKIGVRSRTEATRFVLEHNILDIS